jgi:NNP family nitrate/nitrite transporter-like MFS transporter
MSGARLAAASLGIVSAIGAYGGFVIPQVLRISYEQTKGYDLAFGCFAGAYLIMLAITWFCYLRPGSPMAARRI